VVARLHDHYAAKKGAEAAGATPEFARARSTTSIVAKVSYPKQHHYSIPDTVAIPMNAAVVAVLDKLEERRNGSPYVFPHMQGEQEGEAIKDVKNSFRTALKNAKIENFRFHDLHHCCRVMVDDEWSRPQ